MTGAKRFRKLWTMCVWASALTASAQSVIPPLREIHLPMTSSRGSFAPIWYPDLVAEKHFSMRTSNDQSLLIFDAAASGNWPLIRVKQWWSNTPISETLIVRGWSPTETKNIETLLVDLQITPDGRYAVAFAGVRWMDNSDFIFGQPRGYVAHKPDTIVTVIDLQSWKIMGSIHTLSSSETSVTSARIVSDKWLALESSLGEIPSSHGIYRFLDRLISLPDLKPGSQCVLETLSHLWQPPIGLTAESIKVSNEVACTNVVAVTATGSAEALETLIRRGEKIEPPEVKIHALDFVDHSEARGEVQKLWQAELNEEQFFHWGEYPYYRLYAENPPLESSAHLWYSLFDAHQNGLYELGRYDAQGAKEVGKTVQHLACGDSAIDKPNSACGCRVIDVSEQQRELLSYCRTQRGDYEGSVRREWLSIFRSDDLSPVGFIELSRNREELAAISSGDGHAYVVTVEFGETLRVYAIPRRS